MKRWLRIAARLAWILLVLASAWLPEDRPAEGLGYASTGARSRGRARVGRHPRAVTFAG
jgi:hypothetical protein